MAVVSEFRSFIAKGNVIDLAVGIIIGGAFTGIVTSLVNDIITPVLGAIIGGIDFSDYFIPLSSTVISPTLVDARGEGAVVAYGSFITVVLNFLILAWIIFLMVKAVNRIRITEEKKPDAAVPAAPPPADVQLLTEIRDLLKAR